MADRVLITIPISHYCEKARWALDRAGLAYEERRHLQVLHWVAVRRAGGGRTAPVLTCEEGVLPESAEILGFADRRTQTGRRLYPGDAGEVAAIRALEHDFDEGLGPSARAWMYHQLRGHRDLAVGYATAGVPAWQRRAFPLGYPVVMRVIDRYLKITPESAARAEAEVRATFDRVAERLADGRPYLAGDSFTAADLTFSALAAAVLVPPEYGVALPQPDELPAGMAATVRELRAHPAGRHALAMFRDERRPAG